MLSVLPSATTFQWLLHWLPIQKHIVFKITAITHKVWLHRQPSYLSDLIADYIPAWLLHSSGKGLLLVPCTKTQIAARAFRIAAPKIWNNLQHPIHSITTTSSFYKQLNTHICASVYGESLRLSLTPLTHFASFRCAENHGA